MVECTAVAPVNIALIKYWGKRDVALNLPTNASLSVTLESIGEGEMKLLTTTTAKICDDGIETDRIALNGVLSTPNARVQRVLKYVRSIHSLPSVTFTSSNMFPTAAGLASSAAGLAALVEALSGIVPLSEEQKSIAARLGSGSACRSLFDGYVLWRRGGDDNCGGGGSDDGSNIDNTTDTGDGNINSRMNPHSSHVDILSVASSLLPSEHWPEMRCLVMVLSTQEKDVPSAVGMEQSRATSSLYNARLQLIPSRIEALMEAITQHDFPTFAKIVMQESNQLHAICMDSYPPIFYLNEQSKMIINAVHRLNEESIMAAYTFDAGPNAFVFCLEQHIERLKVELLSVVPTAQMIECKVGRGAHKLVDRLV